LPSRTCRKSRVDRIDRDEWLGEKSRAVKIEERPDRTGSDRGHGVAGPDPSVQHPTSYPVGPMPVAGEVGLAHPDINADGASECSWDTRLARGRTIGLGNGEHRVVKSVWYLTEGGAR
jgi:hypothetical protein